MSARLPLRFAVALAALAAPLEGCRNGELCVRDQTAQCACPAGSVEPACTTFAQVVGCGEIDAGAEACRQAPCCVAAPDGGIDAAPGDGPTGGGG
jgi:hypothetical protein